MDSSDRGLKSEREKERREESWTSRRRGESNDGKNERKKAADEKRIREYTSKEVKYR
jgi:hypothetical protein